MDLIYYIFGQTTGKHRVLHKITKAKQNEQQPLRSFPAAFGAEFTGI